jgi:aminoglycoside phosphotransferase (APT) family kinase protein
VRFAAPEAEVSGEAEAVGEVPVPVPEAAAAPPPAAVIDADLIYAIVRRVVLKMAPPALPVQMIEEMARQFADEILAELGEAPPQSE